MLEGFLRLSWETWFRAWGFLGPTILIVFIFYLKYPEKFEKIFVHILWLISIFSKEYEKRAIAKEVTLLSFRLKEIYSSQATQIEKISIEWSDEEQILFDLKQGRLIIYLKPGIKSMEINIAKALMNAIPSILSYELVSVYDEKLIKCLSTHIARGLVRDYPSIVDAINLLLADYIRKDGTYGEISSKLIAIDDASYLSRIFLPELIEVARKRYPYRDPDIDTEVFLLLDLLYALCLGKDVENPWVRGKYFKVLFVRVGEEEKVFERMLQPHLEFIKAWILRKKIVFSSVYILAAGKYTKFIPALINLVKYDEEIKHLVVLDKIEEYRGVYKNNPATKICIGRIKIKEG